MKFSLSLALGLCLLARSADAQHSDAMAPARPVTLIAGLGTLHHPVSTSCPAAQQFFDQGLRLVYAFNHEGAVRSFKKAAELDPQLAMAYWGIGLALGPYINMPTLSPEREKAAYEATQKAVALSATAPLQERAYIAALAKRYSNDPKADFAKLGIQYKEAMGELARRYPDDMDAATLYAESAMDLHPWKLWTLDGKPAEGTEEIVAVLESVLRREPHHIGANHYYIHAVEASAHPERALPSADRLSALAPAAGHLVHMPSHIYIRVGDYERAARQNEAAVAADEAYIEKTGLHGRYAAMYFSHNLQFLAVARAMQGHYEQARTAAAKLQDNITPYLNEMPMLERFLTTPILVQVRCRRWDDLLKSAAPSQSHLVLAFWHFARGQAYAATGKIAEAERERQDLQQEIRAIPADTMYSHSSKISSLWPVLEGVLDARIASAQGDRRRAVEYLRAAAQAEAELAYSEPPMWYDPVAETLGGTLYLMGEYAAAERVFRGDLEKCPRNGRGLFGLMESLKKQRKDYPAQLVEAEFNMAWKGADTPLRVDGF